MKPSSSRPADSVIRITHQDAQKPEVDDFLKRQKSLQGDTHIGYGKRKWYYQSWFVSMVLAAIGAFIAWAIIEPHYDDYAYLQGPIEDIRLDAFPPSIFGEGDEALMFDGTLRGAIELEGNAIWLYTEVEDLQAETPGTVFDIETLRVGQEIGVHVEYYETFTDYLAIGYVIDTQPPTVPPAKAQLSLSEQVTKSSTMGLLIFGIVASLIGLGLGLADGLVCRLPRRALIAGGIGLAVGFLGGLISSVLADIVYAPLSQIAMQNEGDTAGGLSTLGFLVQMGGRGLAWGIAGMAMGLGQGIALRSGRLLLYGFLGGVVGGLLGGLVFDPIDLLIFGAQPLTTHWSRMVGFVCIGAAVGAMTGIVELLARDSWLRMVKGPLAGKEFVVFKDMMRIGASPKSDIYLFNDPLVEHLHATLRAVGEQYEIENKANDHALEVNDRPVKCVRLRHGDKIRLGATEFVYESSQ